MERLAAAFAICGLVILMLTFLALSREALAQDDPRRTNLAAAGAYADVDALDLEALQSGLRATRAIGALTKLKLKSRYDALIQDVRKFHIGEAGDSLDSLRKRFEGLLDRVLDLVRSEDPSLFRTLQRSRIGLWRLLSDPRRFAAADRRTTVASLAVRQDR